MTRRATHRRTLPGRNSQQGFSLIMTLLFVVSALVLGVSVLGVNVMQERIIGNTKDRDLALQAAEAALRDAEQDIQLSVTSGTLFSDSCLNGFCTPPTQRVVVSPLPVDKQVGFDWATAGNVRRYGQYTAAPALPTVSAQPAYVIEKLGSMGTPAGDSATMGVNPNSTGVGYRITARGTGARAETVVVLQSIFATR
jgi:type IV pilus assembly protein PilX